jgi:hypothetical protein
VQSWEERDVVALHCSINIVLRLRTDADVLIAIEELGAYCPRYVVYEFSSFYRWNQPAALAECRIQNVQSVCRTGAEQNYYMYPKPKIGKGNFYQN